MYIHIFSLNASENLLKLCCPKVTKGLEEGVILSWHPVMAAHNFPSVKSKWYRIYHNKDQKGVVKKVLKVDKRHIVLLIKSNSEANMFGEPLFQCSDSYLEKSILGLNFDRKKGQHRWAAYWLFLFFGAKKPNVSKCVFLGQHSYPPFLHLHVTNKNMHTNILTSLVDFKILFLLLIKSL